MNTVRITIPFYDKPLVLIDHNERPFVAMRPIVEGMGMDWAGQQRKLKDRFASTVDILSTVADDGRKRAMLPLAWLNTIHMPLTPPPPLRRMPPVAICGTGLTARNYNGRHAAPRGFFMPAIPLCGTFYGWQGGGGLMPAGFVVSSLSTRPFVARPAFDSATRASIYNAKDTP